MTLIKTVKGQTIYLAHNTRRPAAVQPPEQGAGHEGPDSGLARSDPHRGPQSETTSGRPLDKFYEEYEHPLWKSEKVKKATRGHGGMDFLEDFRFIECLRAGLPADMNVYDAAA